MGASGGDGLTGVEVSENTLEASRFLIVCVIRIGRQPAAVTTLVLETNLAEILFSSYYGFDLMYKYINLFFK